MVVGTARDPLLRSAAAIRCCDPLLRSAAAIRCCDPLLRSATSVADHQDGAVGVLDDGVGDAAHERP